MQPCVLLEILIIPLLMGSTMTSWAHVCTDLSKALHHSKKISSELILKMNIGM